ncbi:MAG: RNA polymerase sigma factor [Methyloligellaceae bacterium]
MSDLARLGTTLAAVRPQVVGALARHFRDIDKAEDAFQTACERALKRWPETGRPADPAAWLIRVGRNAGIDALRRERRFEPLEGEPEPDAPDDAEAATIERLEADAYRDDILRLLFICSHPELQQSDQLTLALKVVAGLAVKEIARAFLVSPKAMEQRITRAKRKVADARISFETPSLAERTERLAAVSTMLYLLFNEGYSSAGDGAHVRASLCEEAIRLIRLLLRLFPGQSEVTGLLALCLFQHARARARLDAEGEIILLEDQDRGLWDPFLIAEGRVLLEKALLKGRPGPYQVQAAIAGVHCAAARPEATDWAEIDRLYAALERLQPSPVVTPNRAVAVSKVAGPEAALAMIEPLASILARYLYFHGVHGALLEELGRLSDAHEAYGRALALCTTPAETAHLKAKLDALQEKLGRAVG